MHIRTKRNLARLNQLLTREFIEEYYIQKQLSILDIAKIAKCRHHHITSKINEFGITRITPSRPTAILDVNQVRQMGFEYISGYKGSKYKAKFRCSCGRVFSTVVDGLLRGHTKSCGCSKMKQNNVKWLGYMEISKSMFNRLLNNAKTRNITVQITIEDIWNQYIKQKRKCALSGQELIWGVFAHGDCTASVDRIDSSKGYTLDNIQIIHKDINKMKMNFAQDYFLQICKMCTEAHNEM